MKEKLAIGMFDSGIGGLTVLRAMHQLMPHEEIIYLGDTARQFYGEKTPETVLRYSIENALFLMDHSIKMLVIACNTAASVSVERLRKLFNIPVIGVIEPGAKAALQASRQGRIAVLGTKGTIRSGAYQNHIKKLKTDAFVLPIECPLLAPLVEEGMHAHLASRLILRDYLAPLQKNPVDTILLGCTHYPLLKELILEEVGPHVAIIDSAISCAEEVKNTLALENMGNCAQMPSPTRYFVSENPEKFKIQGERFLEKAIPLVSLMTIV